jgi:hypothetical protein
MTRENVEDRYTSLVPASGWSAVYYQISLPLMYTRQIICWGLRSDGRAVPLRAERTGALKDATGYRNFVGVRHDSEPDDPNISRRWAVALLAAVGATRDAERVQKVAAWLETL